jgi:hypothetical protein
MRAYLLIPLTLIVAACGNHGPRRGGPGSMDALGPYKTQFEAADADGDEQLSRDEVAGGMPELLPRFETVDTDHNERISNAELSSYLEWQRIVKAPPPKAMRDRDR